MITILYNKVNHRNVLSRNCETAAPVESFFFFNRHTYRYDAIKTAVV